jgi:hypothetical protein
VLDRLLEILRKLQAKDDVDFEEHARFLEATFNAGAARIRRGVASLDLRTRIAVACVATGIAAILVSATIPAIGAIGSGYFLRFGILIIGIGLHLVLRR